MENILRLPSVPDELLEDKLTKVMDALGDSEDPGLLELVFHVALVLVLFPSRITRLFRNICFKPDMVKVSREAEVHSAFQPAVLVQYFLADALCFGQLVVL